MPQFGIPMFDGLNHEHDQAPPEPTTVYANQILDSTIDVQRASTSQGPATRRSDPRRWTARGWPTAAMRSS
jgi:hypothetical protein